MSYKHLGYYVKNIDKNLNENKNNMLKDYGITSQQFHVIIYLTDHSNEEVNQKNIEEFMDSSAATVSGILSRLEANEFIKRVVSKADSRCKVIVPTEKALALRNEIFKRFYENENEFFSNFNEKEKNELFSLLDKLLINMKRSKER